MRSPADEGEEVQTSATRSAEGGELKWNRDFGTTRRLRPKISSEKWSF